MPLKPAFIDLSHHNVVPDSLIPARQSGIVGVIHKLTEDTDYVDPKVDNRFFLAQQAGLLWGLYHFVRPGNIEGQVQHFLENAESVSDDYTLYCLDWEDSGVSLDDAVGFLQRVEQITGRAPVLYSGHVLKEALDSTADPRISQYRLWLAQYASAPTLPPGWSKYWGWQYTEDGECPGIEPPVDLNAYDGTADELRNDWSGAGVAPAPEVEVEVTVIVPPGVKVKVVVED